MVHAFFIGCRRSLPTVALLVGLLGCSVGAGAQAGGTWQVGKLSGRAWMIAPSAQRTDLSVGVAVPDGMTVFTADRARLQLVRGTESMMLGPGSVIALSPTPTAGMTTTVLQQMGSVAFDVERQAVQHFSVETPVMAAVVKGTHFTVQVDAGGAANVSVDRGLVGVTGLASGQTADISPGQRASVAAGGRGGMTVSGIGHPAVTRGPRRAAMIGSFASFAAATTAVATTPANLRAAVAAVAESAGFASAQSMASAAGVSAPAATSTASSVGGTAGNGSARTSGNMANGTAAAAASPASAPAASQPGFAAPSGMAMGAAASSAAGSGAVPSGTAASSAPAGATATLAAPAATSTNSSPGAPTTAAMSNSASSTASTTAGASTGATQAATTAVATTAAQGGSALAALARAIGLAVARAESLPRGQGGSLNTTGGLSLGLGRGR